jgi:hypothetical protein
VRAAIIFLTCFLFASVSPAADSTKTYTASTIRFVGLKELRQDTLVFRKIDTTLNQAQIFNPVFKNNRASLYLGNLGTAYHDLFFNPARNLNFDEGMHAFDLYLTRPEDLKFYRTLSPYSRLNYTWNQKKEQLFELTFAQNITPRLNYAVNFGRLVSEGDYQRQKADHLNFDGSLWYQSKNKRYLAVAAYISNSLRVQENGGIKNDSIFRVPSQLQTEFEPVFLSNAENRINNSHIYFRQSYDLGPNDSIKLDTTYIPRVIPRHRFSHSIDLHQRKYNYFENSIDSMYALTLIDPEKTRDQLRVRELTNELSYQFFAKHRSNTSGLFRGTTIGLSLKHHYVNYYQQTFDTLFQSVEPGISLSTLIVPKVRLLVTAESHVYLNNEGDFAQHASSALRYEFVPEDHYIQLGYRLRSALAPFNTQYFYSNHFTWSNQFDNLIAHTADLNYINRKLRLEVKTSITDLKNYIYYTDAGYPAQYTGAIQVLALEIRKDFTLGKFHLDNQVIAQKSSDDDILRQPYLYAFNSFYFESYVFKKAMRLRTGIDSRYYTSYYGYDYNPATSQFIQENTLAFGDYPVLDFFIAAKVKRATLLFKLDHANQQLTKSGYYMIRSYPIPERTFKIGVNWAFYD